MNSIQVFFVLAITLNLTLAMTFRHRRQTNDGDENNLDDRYGWDRPQRPWGNPWQNQNQNWQNQDQQRPRPNQGGRWPVLPDEPNQGGQQPTPSPVPNGSSTQAPSVQACIRSCPVTSEYNPVCGTNMMQYENPGRLTCAQSCGVSVGLFRSSPCPTTTTVAPPS